MHRLILAIGLALLSAGAFAFAGRVQTTQAAAGTIFTVNSPADAPDANFNDGQCDTGAGACTLRAAIQQSNFSPGPDVINIGPLTVTLTRPGNDDTAWLGDLDISGTVTIDGAGASLSYVHGNGQVTHDRVFHVLPGAYVLIRDVSILSGRAYSSTEPYGGNLYVAAGGRLVLENVVVEDGAANSGGAIFNDGTLTMTVALVGRSLASHGGGIYNSGVLSGVFTYIYYNTASADGAGFYNGGGGTRASLSSSYIYNNFAVSAGDVISTEGGAFYNQAVLTLTQTAVSYNGSNLGGGLYNGTNGLLRLTQSLVNGNNGHLGGGIINFGTLGAVDSLLQQNTAVLRGGAIYNGGIPGGMLLLTNSTLSGNRSDDAGGGLFQFSGTTLLFNATIASNVADDNDDDASDGGGIKHVGGTITLRNSIVANNIHRAFGFPLPVPDDCKGALTSEGYNLIESITGCTVGGVPTGNLVGQDPQLMPLADNGGHTETHALRANSPARDAGNPSGCTDSIGTVLTADQRGKRRPADGDGNGVARCDMGAYEAQVELFLPLIRR